MAAIGRHCTRNSMTCTKWLAAQKTMTVHRNVARCFRVRPMIRKTQRHTDILARPIPMILNICEMTLHLSTRGICSRGRQYMCLPKPIRTNLVSQPTPMIPAICKTLVKPQRLFRLDMTDQAGHYCIIICSDAVLKTQLDVQA